MTPEPNTASLSVTGKLTGAAAALLAVTGFMQMPIAKRYYIADIPLMGWLGDFYLTHWLHYLGATVFLALAAYNAATFLLARNRHLTGWGKAGTAALTGLILTGALLVVRNLAGMVLNPALIIVLDLSHLMLSMVLVVVAGATLATKRPWTMPAQPFKKATGDR